VGEFRGVAAIHVNSDWPVEFDGDGARGISDHDPVVARFRALTVDGLIALLWYLRSTGAITTREAALALQEYLLQARQYAADGQWTSYADQLRRFSGEVERLAPQTVTRPAADALQKEAAILSWMR
jgi:hypothetical protein